MKLTFIMFFIFIFSSKSFGSGYGYTHKRCESKEGGNVVLPFNSDTNEIIKECVPEVLYSWKSKQKIKQYIETMSDENFLPFGQTLWTWRTPIGTFGYGDYVLRIKLKPNLNVFWNRRWDESGGCKYLDANQKKNTIIFGYYGGKNYSEYVICSQEAIESWSYGTSEIQIEMMNEYEWVEKNKTKSDMYDRFYKTKSNQNFTDKDYSPSNYFNFSIDEKDWTKRALNEKFSNMETLVNGDHPGKVFYQQGMSKSRINHYKVKYPDYFNL
jgi:hypothetical protein